MIILVQGSMTNLIRSYNRFKNPKSNTTLSRVLSIEEKFEFVKTSVSWIKGKSIMDTCFILNFGFEAPLPWPQVYVGMGFYNFDNI